MAIISTSSATERLSRKLQRAGINKWIAQSSSDSWGKYLVFEIGGFCVGSAGWNLTDAKATVNRLIIDKDCEELPQSI